LKLLQPQPPLLLLLQQASDKEHAAQAHLRH
jgi:hypothetical protein